MVCNFLKAKLPVFYLKLNQSEWHIYSSSQNTQRLIGTERPALSSWNLACGVPAGLPAPTHSPTLTGSFSGITWQHSITGLKKQVYLGPISVLRLTYGTFRKAAACKKESALGRGCWLSVLWKYTAEGTVGSTYLSLSTVVSWKAVNQHWFPIGICQLCRLQSCGEGGKNSLGDLFAVSMNRCSSSTTDFSLFWSLSSKGKVLPKVGFHRPPPGPAMDVLVLLLKCGELCHRRP